MCRLLLLVALAALAALARSAEAQCACPKPSTQANFQPEMYFGEWYQMKRVSRGNERNGQCAIASYRWKDDTKTVVDVLNTNYVPSFDAMYAVSLIATPVDIENAKLVVTWPSQPQVPPNIYWVLGTDYTTYSVVYNCAEIPGASLPSITLWVMARNYSKFDSNTLTTVNNILSTSGFSNIELDDIRHDCPPPKCTSCPTSESLSSLDVAKMAGRWWEIQHSPFSTGSSVKSCTLADVSGTDDGVSIDFINFRGDQGKDEKNTLVAKRKRNGEFTITGGAGGDPNDSICIVDTDYDNWAVLSICAKPLSEDQSSLPDGFTRANFGGVYVMSRTKGLRSEHQLAANRALLSVGYAPSSMETTMSSPCPAAAFAESAATHGLPSAFVLSLLMTALFLVKP